MPPDLRDSGKRILVRRHRTDGLLSSSGNAVIAAIVFVRAVGNVIRPFQLGKINILSWNILNGRIRRFEERQGIAGIGNDAPRRGHDYASGIALDGNRMIRAWKLLFFHLASPFSSGSAPWELCDVRVVTHKKSRLWGRPGTSQPAFLHPRGWTHRSCM